MPDMSPGQELKQLRGKTTQEDMARLLSLKLRTYIRYELSEVRSVPSVVMDAARRLRKGR